MSNLEYCCLLFKMAGMRIQIVYKKSCVAVMKKVLWLMQEGMCDEKVKSHLTTGIQKQGILIMIEEDKFVIDRKGATE